jgi:hypothetical protein
MIDEYNAELDEGTWAWHHKQHWDAFNDCIREMNSDGTMDHWKLRDYVLYDMNKRHQQEK